MLITAGDQSGYNTMTASWGGLGVLWGKNVATCYIRRSATNKEIRRLLERIPFTLSFTGPEHKQALSICGSKSGRDCDKGQRSRSDSVLSLTRYSSFRGSRHGLRLQKALRG